MTYTQNHLLDRPHALRHHFIRTPQARGLFASLPADPPRASARHTVQWDQELMTQEDCQFQTFKSPSSGAAAWKQVRAFPFFPSIFTLKLFFLIPHG